MPWVIQREGLTLRVQIDPPMVDDWDDLMDEIRVRLVPKPLAVYLPSRIEGASQTDADMLKVLWRTLADIGIPVLPPS